MSLYDNLKSDVITGVYPPGSKLKIDSLKERYGSGVNVLRENLMRLSCEGLIEAEDQRGFRMASYEIGRMRELTRMRLLLEIDGAKHSFVHGGVDWESNLVAAHHKLAYMESKMQEDEVEHFAMWHQCDYEFHAALIAACDSALHQRFHKRVYDQFRQFVVIELKTNGFRGHDIVDEHEAVMNAALARDIDSLSTALEKHLSAFVDRLNTHNEGHTTNSQ